MGRKGDGNWGRMILGILIYFFLVPVIYKLAKCGQNKHLRQAHFMLAVTCRAENNRYYLKRGVEVRPGYLARWVEFSVLETNSRPQILRKMLQRHEKSQA